MKKNNLIFLAIIFILFVISIKNTAFVVKQIDQAIVLQFGKPVRIIAEAGLNFKIPYMQEVVLLDKRLLTLNVTDKEVLDSEQKRLIINAFAKYKITDPLKFYNVFRGSASRDGSFSQLNNMLESSLRQVVGEYTINDLLSQKRTTIMESISKILNEKIEQYGIYIADVRIMRADLPKANSMSIFRRMQTERELEAKQIRAEGEESAKRIIAETDKEKVILLSEANKKSKILKGEAEAVVGGLFNRSFGYDIEFYEFYKSMQVYKETINKGNTKLILNPDSSFLKGLGL